MRKAIITVLTLVLILGACVFPAAAAGTGSLSMTGTEGKQGDTVTVAVNLSSNPGLITMKFAVSYPSDLELLSVSNSGLLGGWTTPAPTISSPYTIRWADSLAVANNTATGKIVTLTFKIKDSATPGSKTVSLTFNESRDVNGSKNTFANASAIVKVNCKSHSFGGYTRVDDTQHSRTCSACGYIEATNHNWNSGSVTKPASCKEAGEKKFTCTTCNATKTEAIAKLTTHTYGSWIQVNETTHNRTCSVCQKVETGNHSWNSGTITKPTSCKEAGEKTFTCATCNAIKTDVIEKLTTHTCGSWTKVNDTTHKRTCSVCTKEETANHSWSSGTVTQKATCKETGVKTYTCTVCNATKMEDIAKLTTHTYDHACDTGCNVCGLTRSVTHSYKLEWSKDKTDHWHECVVCKDKKDSAAHAPGAEVTETTAQTCTVCGYIIKPALGHKHSYATTWTTDDMGHWYPCSGCEEKNSYTDHNFDDACDTDCSICGYTRETKHTYDEKWTSDETNHWHICSGCGLKSDEAAHEPGAEATEMTAQTCTICGYEIAPALGSKTTEPTDATKTTEPTNADEPTTPVEQDPPAKENFSWWIILVVAVVVGGCIAAFVIIKKKKN